ncbi:MAG: two-component sensor histidine kinase [Ruminococcus sp.]|nr:two-component sensor histidine kinase [Ruminococcus sp.]
MRKRIFLGTFSSCLVVILLCTFLIAGFLFNYYSNHQKESMQTQIGYLVHMAEEHNVEHLSSFSEKQHIFILDENKNLILKNTEKINITDELKDNIFNNTDTDEYGYTTEVLGFSDKQIVVSSKLSNGSVLCLSDTQHTYISMLSSILGYVGIVLGFAAVVSLILARKFSARILRPVFEMNLSSPDKSKVYPELAPFVDKIQEQNEEIKRRVTQITTEHEEQDKMRREFTANVSHELKTPLTSISGYAEIIRDGMVQPADIPKFAGRIYDESKRMINLVGDIIKLSQLDEKDVTVNIERIDLYDCCQAVIHSLEHQAQKRNITFSLEGDHCEINGAEVIIEEIIHNICDNAIKYNKEGGKVFISLKQCIDGVELSVKDTGIGISEEDLGHVFERFYRADKSHSKEIGGTGLGLSIVKHGAKFHNAYVTIDSTLGEGTTVRILF